jgi:hypothetical protein
MTILVTAAFVMGAIFFAFDQISPQKIAYYNTSYAARDRSIS